jgi:hypothetical protein
MALMTAFPTSLNTRRTVISELQVGHDQPLQMPSTNALDNFGSGRLATYLLHFLTLRETRSGLAPP